MPTYLIIEERNEADESVSYEKYDITEPPLPSVIMLHKGGLEVSWVEDLYRHMRRTGQDLLGGAPYLAEGPMMPQ